MNPATRPREERLTSRLLCIDPETGGFDDHWIRELPDLLEDGDLLVVNDAATVPASLPGTTQAGETIEVRLAGSGSREGDWMAILFGAGDWRMRTEDRPLSPVLKVGELLRFGENLAATVRRVSPVSPRLVELAFPRDTSAFWRAVYRHGRPIQYSHLDGPIRLWDVQTSYGARPWAVESPSAGLTLNWDLLEALKRRGIGLAAVTHGAGLSSTGDPALDALLPLPERFDVPAATVEAVREAHQRGARVVAVGTTVVRALEGSAAENGGVLQPGPGVTRLRVDASFTPAIVDGLLTGVHEPGTTHFALMTAFAPPDLLADASRHADAQGYLGHEFGDSMLIARGLRLELRGRQSAVKVAIRSSPS